MHKKLNLTYNAHRYANTKWGWHAGFYIVYSIKWFLEFSVSGDASAFVLGLEINKKSINISLGFVSLRIEFHQNA